MTVHTPFYDPTKSYEENYMYGPFGKLADHTKIQRHGEPTYTLFSHALYSPFGIPAGPLINSNFTTQAFSHGFDICVYKTVRSRAHACHPYPNVLAVHPKQKLEPNQAEPLTADTNYSEPVSITNSFGVPSMDPQVWQEDMRQALTKVGKGQLLIGSFQGTSDGSGDVQKYVDDFVQTALLVKDTGVKVLEANLSCPNEGTAHLLCFDIERTTTIAKKIKTAIGDTPLILKGAYFQDEGQLEQLVMAVGNIIDGISVINTIPAVIVDSEQNQALPGKGRSVSGVCGDAIRWAGLSMVERVKALKQKHKMHFTIIGVGGVMNPDHVLSYRNNGADAVMSATGAMWNPDLGKEVYTVLTK